MPPAAPVQGDRRTDKQTDGHHHCVKPPPLWQELNPLIATLKPQSNRPSYSNTVTGTLTIDGWAVTFGTARSRLGGGCSLPRTLRAVLNVTAIHQWPVYQLCIIRCGTIIAFGV